MTGVAIDAPRVDRRWGRGIINYFTAKERRVLLKIDIFLLVWAFIAGLTKVSSFKKRQSKTISDLPATGYGPIIDDPGLCFRDEGSFGAERQ